MLVTGSFDVCSGVVKVTCFTESGVFCSVDVSLIGFREEVVFKLNFAGSSGKFVDAEIGTILVGVVIGVKVVPFGTLIVSKVVDTGPKLNVFVV